MAQCNTTGTLLQPDRPATLVDSLLAARCARGGDGGNATNGGDHVGANGEGEVYVTHCLGAADDAAGVAAWLVVSFKVRGGAMAGRSVLRNDD